VAAEPVVGLVERDVGDCARRRTAPSVRRRRSRRPRPGAGSAGHRGPQASEVEEGDRVVVGWSEPPSGSTVMPAPIAVAASPLSSTSGRPFVRHQPRRDHRRRRLQPELVDLAGGDRRHVVGDEHRRRASRSGTTVARAPSSFAVTGRVGGGAPVGGPVGLGRLPGVPGSPAPVPTAATAAAATRKAAKRRPPAGPPALTVVLGRARPGGSGRTVLMSASTRRAARRRRSDLVVSAEQRRGLAEAGDLGAAVGALGQVRSNGRARCRRGRRRRRRRTGRGCRSCRPLPSCRAAGSVRPGSGSWRCRPAGRAWSPPPCACSRRSRPARRPRADVGVRVLECPRTRPGLERGGGRLGGESCSTGWFSGGTSRRGGWPPRRSGPGRPPCGARSSAARRRRCPAGSKRAAVRQISRKASWVTSSAWAGSRTTRSARP
jgi:hypothetical protein